MSLAKIISQAITEDLDLYKKEQEKKVAVLKKEEDQSLQKLQKLYTETVEAQVNEQVYLQSYVVQRDVAFKNTKSISDDIDQIYQEILPQIFETRFFQDSIDDFFRTLSKDVTVTVSGKYAGELEKFVKEKGISCKIAEASSLGSIHYVTEFQEGEFRMEDVLEQVKARTIEQVMKLLRKND